MNLEIIKSMIPDFQMKDFIMFDIITLLKWETVFDDLGEESKKLSMTITSFNHYQIQIEFVNVISLQFRGTGQVSGFYIRDMSIRGYENCSRYEVGDFEDDEIRFYCEDVIIRNLERITEICNIVS